MMKKRKKNCSPKKNHSLGKQSWSEWKKENFFGKTIRKKLL